MLGDYLNVRGIGDSLAGGTTLVVVTMVAHYWGYATLTDMDLLSYFALEDYLRLSITFIPIVILFIVLTFIPFYVGGNTKTDKMKDATREYVYMGISISLLLMVTGGLIYSLVTQFINPLLGLVIFILSVIGIMMYSNYIFVKINEISFINVVLVGSLLWAMLSFGAGLGFAFRSLNAEFPSVAVHVNYCKEPIEGNILINLSNTLLLSESGSTSYTALSQSEIRSIERLKD